jgi:hypothetical protein
MRHAFFLACLCYWLFLTVLLLVPDPAALVGLEAIPVFPWGKFGVHLIAFTILGFLVNATRWPKRIGWSMLVFLIVYGITTESLQLFVPQRSARVMDGIENILGIVTGSAIYWLLLRLTLPKAMSSFDTGNGTVTYETVRQAMNGKPLTMSLTAEDKSCAVVEAVNEGIDDHRETCYRLDRGDRYGEGERLVERLFLCRTLECTISPESMPVLLRRLCESELGGDPEVQVEGNWLANDILNCLGIIDYDEQPNRATRRQTPCQALTSHPRMLRNRKSCLGRGHAANDLSLN